MIAGENAHNFLEVVLSRLWEGHFGRRTMTKTKTMETSRDDGSAGGVSREIRRRRPPPPQTKDETHPEVSPLLSSLSDGASTRDGARTMATAERGIHRRRQQERLHKTMR
jgi:hypothetical protein